MKYLLRTFLFLAGLLFVPTVVFAQAEPALADQVKALSNHVDWLWTVIAACLVFFMQAGFSYVEGGFTRAKNVVNIMMKNMADLSIGAIGFWAIGFGLMFSGGVYEFFVNPDVNAFGEDPNWMYAFLYSMTILVNLS